MTMFIYSKDDTSIDRRLEGILGFLSNIDCSRGRLPPTVSLSYIKFQLLLWSLYKDISNLVTISQACCLSI